MSNVPSRSSMLVLSAFLACSGGEQAEDEGSSSTDAVRVEIVEPAAGAEVDGPDVRVVLRAYGIEIAPVADARAGTAHHHLFMDRDLTALDLTIPTNDEMIVHLGGGQTEHIFTGLEPGPHRLIALLADLAHVPLQPTAADTVEFTLR